VGVPAGVRPTRYGKYTLVAKLATGGMADIFLARLHGAAGFEKLMCVKRLLPQLAKDPQFVSMFLSEAKIAAQISHPNVCQVFELGEVEGSYFIAMEYLEGVPLAVFRRTDLYASRPDPRLVAGLGLQACEGLHHAHQLKHADGSSLDVVHRDVSGNNLFATVDGIVKVLDFGIAKAHDRGAVKTSTGAVKGTYAYMAPEQLRGERLDRRTDVFALGVVLWELLAQRYLFRRDTDFLTFQAITSEAPPSLGEIRADVPPALADAIARALARERDQRFATARAFGEALATAVAPLGGPLQAGGIADALERGFVDRLRDQRAMLRQVRDGRTFDLDTEVGADVGHGVATTPISGLLDAGAPSPSPSPSGRTTSTTVNVRLGRSPWWWAVGVIVAAAVAVAVTMVARGHDSEQPRVDVPVAAPVAMGEPTRTASSREHAPPAVAPPTAPEMVTPPPVTPPGPPTPPSPPVRPPVQRPASPVAPGFITIDATPYATISIDGRALGDTPLVRVELSPGRHAVRAVSSGDGSVRTATVVIESGKTATTLQFK
jgi:serine/threonine-protein kinase